MIRTALGAAAVVAALAAIVLTRTDAAAPAATGPAANTAPVEQGDLNAMVALNGTLTYRARPDGSPYAVINQAKGTYTALPEPGDRIACGAVLYRVDDDAVRLLCGTTPAYRDLEIGDHGKDVRQLNRHLHLPGDAFTWRTAQRLRRRTFDRGDAVFLPAPVRVAKVTAEPGAAARPGTAIAQATDDTLHVQVDLDPSQQRDVRRGDRARITLPDNRAVGGRVERLGRVAEAADDDAVANATIPAFISLANPARARGLDRAPVRVEITTRGVQNALSVPVTALVGKAGGGYAVERVTSTRRELVAVTLGLFDTAGGRVQVEGDLRAGDQVVVPSS